MKLSSHLSAQLLGFLQVLRLNSQIVLTSCQLLRNLLFHLCLLLQIGDVLFLRDGTLPQALDDFDEGFLEDAVIVVSIQWVVARIVALILTHAGQHLDHVVPESLVFNIDDDGLDFVSERLSESPDKVLVESALFPLLRGQFSHLVLQLFEL